MKPDYRSIVDKFWDPMKLTSEIKENKVIMFLTYQINTKDIQKYKNEMSFWEITHKYHDGILTNVYVTFDVIERIWVILPIDHTTSDEENMI